MGTRHKLLSRVSPAGALLALGVLVPAVVGVVLVSRATPDAPTSASSSASTSTSSGAQTSAHTRSDERAGGASATPADDTRSADVAHEGTDPDAAHARTRGCWQAPPFSVPVKASPATIGEPADWQKAYDGLNVPETKHPPRLGVPSEAGVRRGVIAFERDGGVFLFDFAGERETALTAGFRPVFFHDGERLAFVRGADPAERRIVSIDLRTRKERILSGPICDRSSLELAIAPDDRLIAYVAGLGGASDDRAEELHLLDVASGRDEAVGSAEEEISDLAFAPDGRELYFVANGAFMRRRLAVLDVETRLVGRLPEHAEELLQSPQRIGARLLVSAGPMRAMCCLRSDLFTSDLTGVERTRLGTFGIYGYMQARVSPAERFIALSWSARQGGAGADWHDGITVVAADGSDPHDLTAAFPRPFYTAHHPTWAPDDHHVAFTLVIAPYSGSGVGLATIVVADAAEPNKRLVALATGTRAEWQPAPRTFDGRLAVEPSR